MADVLITQEIERCQAMQIRNSTKLHVRETCNGAYVLTAPSGRVEEQTKADGDGERERATISFIPCALCRFAQSFYVLTPRTHALSSRNRQQQCCTEVMHARSTSHEYTVTDANINVPLNSNDRYVKNAHNLLKQLHQCDTDISISAILYRMHDVHVHMTMQYKKKSAKSVGLVSARVHTVFNA